MKKLIMIISILMLMAGCSSVPKGDDINYIDIKSENVDMSGYDGMKSIDHHFMLISPDEFFRVAEEDGSGAFYFGHTGCPSCQHVVKWIEEAATNCDKTVYYIDGYSTVYPLDKEKQDQLYEVLYPVLEEWDGAKTLLTPHFFIMINGEFAASQVGYTENSEEEAVHHFEDMIKLLN